VWGIGGPTSAKTSASAAAQSKPEDTAQEVQEADEQIYPGQPLLGKAWVATRLHMIAEIPHLYKSAQLESTACGVLHTLTEEEGIYAVCETQWQYEGEQFSTRSWITVKPNHNVSTEAVAQGPTTSPSGRIPTPSPASSTAPSAPSESNTTAAESPPSAAPETSRPATGECGTLPETSKADGIGSIHAEGTDCATALTVTASSLQKCSESSSGTCSVHGWSCKSGPLRADEAKVEGDCRKDGDRITWVTIGR
jgi:hypothetical protein